MEDREYSGLWWLPSTEDRVGGTLTISKQGDIHLSLIGSLGKARRSSSKIKVHPVILGFPTKGKSISLFDCRVTRTETHWESGIAEIVVEQYEADRACIGAHLPDPDQLQFRDTWVEYSHSFDWGSRSGFEHERAEGRYGWTYTHPAPIRATTSHGIVSVEYTLNSSEGSSGINLQESTWFRIEPEGDLSFESVMSRFIRPLQNLLSLATGRPNAVLRIQTNLDRETPAEVIISGGYHEPEADKRLHPLEMLFSLGHVQDDFGEILDRWLRVHDELDSVCNLFFATWYRSMYIEHEFLSLVQAVESYHRRRIGGLLLPEEEHKGRVASILAQVPGEYRDWLEKELEYSNEPKLRQRLKELLDNTEKAISPLVGDRRSFIQKVLETRNYLTHYDPKLQGTAAVGVELFRINRALYFLLTVCLLRELGFSIERCTELLRNYRKYQWAVEQAERYPWR
jgi:hypothetical protein